MTAHSLTQLLTAVDTWYRRNGRALPWRMGPEARDAGGRPDPYRVWLSEIMLQQTTIPHASPYFESFVGRWPSVARLADASWEEVSAAWAGLGYYHRARNLHACAKAIVQQGGFPQAASALTQLPGIGPYTAAAIASIAFDERIAPVDGNIERVLSRLYAIGSDGTPAGWRAAKRLIASRAQEMTDALATRHRAGDLAQALMDIGATICVPRTPDCPRCPLKRFCRAREEGHPERYPVKAAKKAVRVRHGSAFVLVRGGQVMLVRRPRSGLLGGMMMPPTGAWSQAVPPDPLQEAPGSFRWRYIGEVRHVFTHFTLKLAVYRAEARTRAQPEGEWFAFSDALSVLPTVGRKAVALALRDEAADASGSASDSA